METLAKYVASATGLELAPTAVASAREYLGSKAVTNAEVIQDDFLSPKTDATYDLGYGTCPLTTHRSPTHGSGLRATHCLLLTACYSLLATHRSLTLLDARRLYILLRVASLNEE